MPGGSLTSKPTRSNTLRYLTASAFFCAQSGMGDHIMKWEYKTVRYEAAGLFSTKAKTDEPDRLLNQLGVDGWELAATLHPTTSSAENLLIFKRATPERR